MPPSLPSEEALAAAGASLGGGGGFRLNAAPRREALVLVDGAPVAIELDDAIEVEPAAEGRLLVSEGGQTWVVSRWRVDGAAAGGAADGAILAPMPGRVIAVEVAAGDHVVKGQRLLTLEAMKMEHALTAPFDGTVAELGAAAGGQVTEGTLLARVDAA